MGWDANANLKEEDPKYKEILEDFVQAAFYVVRYCKCVDGLLKEGSLGLNSCAQVIQEITGHNPYEEKGWPPEKVREVLFDFDPMRYKEYPKGERESFWSTYWFLVVCSKHNLGVTFSY